jgi:erythromycin esterase
MALNRQTLVEGSSRAEFEWVLQHARIAGQFYDAYSRPLFDPESPETTGGALRDRYMAQNIRWLLSTAYPGARMVVWAHNGHVSTNVWGGAVPAMGSHLRHWFGDAYYAFGFDFEEGGFQARHLDPQLPDENYGVLREFVVGPAREGSMAYYLSAWAGGDHALDLRSVPSRGPVHDFFASPLPMANIGAGFSEAYLAQPWRSPISALDHYDGILFIRETSRARPNPSGRRGPIPRHPESTS